MPSKQELLEDRDALLEALEEMRNKLNELLGEEEDEGEE